MSGFNKLDRYKKNVKAVARKTQETEQVNEVVPEITERRTIRNHQSLKIDEEGNTGSEVTQTTTTPVAVTATRAKKDDNPFNEPDSEKNIIFMDRAEIKSLQNTDPQTQQETGSEIGQIKGATLTKLIERVTYDKYVDPNFQSDILLTYRSFTTPRQLLDILIKRYHIPPPKDLSYGELQDWKQNRQKPIRLRVINFLKNWIEKQWKDFTEDAEMSARLHEFLQEDVVSTGFQSSAEQLSKLWDKKREDPYQERELVFSEPPPKPLLPNLKNKTSSTSLGLMDFHSEEIARQLTLIEYNLYKAIKPWEFFNQAWTKKQKEINSPNILRIIKRFNEVSTWVTTEIVKADSLKQRVQTLSKFIEIADKCRSLNNFNAIMEILAGLASSSVYRLKQTWGGLSKQQRELLEELRELMARQGNFSALRRHLKNCNPPVIPYLGLYLTDLTFIEDGNPDLIEGGLINWVKRRRLATVIKDIQQYQQTPYCLAEVIFIQEFLLNYEPLSEDEAYKLSLHREIRVPEKEPKEKKSIFSALKKDKQDKQTSPKTPEKKGSTNSLKPTHEEEDKEDDEEEFEIQYKAGYKFYDKDSENNIILEKDANGMQDKIIAGTLPKLVERLTYEKYPDTSYMTSFLLTFRTFVSQIELMDLLEMRYKIPPPVNSSTAEVMEKFKMQKETPIQLRVLNVCKIWVDKHFEDFKEDRQLLQKLIEFIDSSMLNSPTLSRGGQNLKAQITNKLEAKEEKKQYQFTTSPPSPILPTVSSPLLLDYSPVELARQLTLIDYELFTNIKPLEYLYFTKPSSWSMTSDEQKEEDPINLKSSSHIVAVIYRFADIRDWVTTEILKMDNKEGRAKVIEHFIQVAQNCITLKNFQTFVSIASALSSDTIVNLKTTWQMVSKINLETFVKQRDLTSYRSNFKALRDKLKSIDFPALPFMGMYLRDLSIVKEQMPDTIEPQGFVNFAKRQKMAELIHEINCYQQEPYCLQSVSSIQEYLKTLDIFESAELVNLSVTYQEREGDVSITEDLFESISNSLQQQQRSNSGGQSALSRSSNPSPKGSVTSSIGISPLPSTSPSGSPRASVSSSQQPSFLSPQTRRSVSNNSKEQLAAQQIVTEIQAKEHQEASSSVTTETPQKTQPEPAATPVTPTPEPTTPAPQPEAAPAPTTIEKPPATTTPTPTTTTTPAPTPAPTTAPTPPAEINNVTAAIETVDQVDQHLLKLFPGAKITTWKHDDKDGVVFGWQEDITAKLVTRNATDSYLIPIFEKDGNQKIDKPELSLCIRVGKLYDAEHQDVKKPRLVAFANQVTDTTRPIANKLGIQVIIDRS